MVDDGQAQEKELVRKVVTLALSEGLAVDLLVHVPEQAERPPQRARPWSGGSHGISHHGEWRGKPASTPEERQHGARLGHGISVQEDQAIAVGTSEDGVERVRLSTSLFLLDQSDARVELGEFAHPVGSAVRAPAHDDPHFAPAGRHRKLLIEERTDCALNHRLLVVGDNPPGEFDRGLHPAEANLS